MKVDLGDLHRNEDKTLPSHCGGVPSGSIQPCGIGDAVDDVIDPDVLEQSPMSNKHSALFKISSQ